MTRILVLGADGQVGTALRKTAAPDAAAMLFASRAEVDITNNESVRRGLATLKPDVIVNTAAYANVDGAESAPELAFAVNRDGAGLVARAAADAGVGLVHLSTDYVFDGSKRAPYVETDTRAPLGVYGRSKAEGEDRVLAAHPGAVVLRTSWVFSSYGANFVKAMLKRGADNEEVRVVSDQIGRPTNAADLAQACIAMALRADVSGTFHYAGAGETTWADFAEAIFSEAENHRRSPVKVRRITSAEYPTLAERPMNSRLDTTKIESLGMIPRSWRAGLGDCVAELLSNKIKTAT